MCTQLSLPETFKMEDVPDTLLVEDTKAYTLARLKEKFDKVLANPPKQVDISKRCSPKVFDGIIDHNSAQKALKAKNKRWDKKRKYPKDKNNTVFKCKGWWESEFNTHKHKRAQRVFTQEEYDIDFWYDDEDFVDFYDEEYTDHWDWSDYVDDFGRVLEKEELLASRIDDESCFYCGNYGCDGSCIV